MTEETALRIEAVPHRRVRLSILNDGAAQVFEFESKQSSYIAAQLLRAAAESYLQSGEQPLDFTKNYTEWAVASTTALGLGPSRIPNHESMLFQFGEAVLSFPIEKTKLRQFGEALVALSAKSEQSH